MASSPSWLAQNIRPSFTGNATGDGVDIAPQLSPCPIAREESPQKEGRALGDDEAKVGQGQAHYEPTGADFTIFGPVDETHTWT